MLRGLGCDVMQGFHYARPAPAAATLAWMRLPLEGLAG
jgi:EAL domain-containing protein (putative c-di-GMP-specific phosphodiesterase class I)